MRSQETLARCSPRNSVSAGIRTGPAFGPPFAQMWTSPLSWIESFGRSAAVQGTAALSTELRISDGGEPGVRQTRPRRAVEGLDETACEAHLAINQVELCFDWPCPQSPAESPQSTDAPCARGEELHRRTDFDCGASLFFVSRAFSSPFLTNAGLGGGGPCARRDGAIGHRGSQRKECEVQAKVGDRIVIEAAKVTQPGRAGRIEEVLREEPPTYRVRWDDGRTSVLAPSAGGARVETVTEKRGRATRTA